MNMKVGINGFGRIGRQAFKALLERHPDVEIVAINDLVDTPTNAHMLKYDSNYGRFPGTVEAQSDALVVNGRRIQVLSQRDWAQLGWDKVGVDVVIESTGFGTARADAAKHLEAGAKKVIISAPAKDEDITIVLGVNDEKYDPAQHNIISNASCTTNGLAPVVKVLLDNFGIKHGLMSTVHSYTNTQKLLDLASKDLRDARAAGLNIVPAATGAAKAVALVIPEVRGKFDGIAYRVPTPTVSIVDFVVDLEKDVTKDDIHEAMKRAGQGRMKGILDVVEEPVVSMDFKGTTFSSVVDALSTQVVDGNMARVAAWYDNEWGYACRVSDITAMVAKGQAGATEELAAAAAR
ncbi:MAG TPA: type I glyceraldehyde-3-phosphate dehydrogenase [Chloroflexota bacterium]|nr:type I glyceraldehyde-3-phosphate dehydrogenase [Chloroflexota bacterium]